MQQCAKASLVADFRFCVWGVNDLVVKVHQRPLAGPGRGLLGLLAMDVPKGGSQGCSRGLQGHGWFSRATVCQSSHRHVVRGLFRHPAPKAFFKKSS